MASLTFDFDDQLSEDWISQPRSSDGDISPKRNDLRSSLLQSRIPLPVKPVTGSRQPAPSAHELSHRPSPRPLHTKSKSELCIPATKHGKSRSVSPISPSLARSQSAYHKRSSSAQSWSTDGTVQHFGSEVRHTPAASQMTPEWKRRLLKGQDGGEDAKDLFSPVGLEGVFRPPAARKSSAAAAPSSPKRRGLARSRAEASMVYPSSPPPYPPAGRRRATNKSTSPSPLRDHAPHDQCTGQGGKCEGATRTPTPTSRKVRRRGTKGDGRDNRRGSTTKNGTPGLENSSSVADHERISPVTISRGRIDYRSIQASVLQLRDKMDELGIPERDRPSSRSSDTGIRYDAGANEDDLTQQARTPDAVSPSTLDLRSEAFPTSSRFVATRRGGYSSDDNFHRRPLSPSSFQPNQSFDESRAEIQVSPVRRAQSPALGERLSKSSPIKSRDGGSPLKLFGKHDTYTNNHLMRRLSQYAADPSVQGIGKPKATDGQSATHTVFDGPFDGKKARFGGGNLNTYPFQGGESFLAEAIDDDEPSLPPVLSPKDPPKFQVPRGPGLDSSRRASKALARRISSSQNQQQHFRRPSLAEFRRNIGDLDPRSDGKRTNMSPGKDHQAKRRRTLLSSVASPNASSEAQAPRLVVGKKRKENHAPEEVGQASLKTLTSRTILRPASASSRSHSPASSMSSWLGVASSRQVSQEAVSVNGLDQSTKLLAEDLANFALNVAESITKGERKASVTTADFFKEANMIMKHLRGQLRTPSGRGSVDASLVEPMPEIQEHEEDEDEDEDKDVHRLAEEMDSSKQSRQPSLRLSSKLSKFKEQDDPTSTLGASFKNLQLDPAAPPQKPFLPDSDPNIRISRASPESLATIAEEDQMRTRSSVGNSLPRSIRTGSSTNSSKKFNIAPETIKGLLSDQVGRMIFDHEKGVWIRNRTMSGDTRPGSAHFTSDNTEEDPLKSIPDLEDDELSGMQLLRSDASSGNASNATVITKSKDGGSMRDKDGVGYDLEQAEMESRPSTGNGAESSQLSKFSKFGSSHTAPDTRATSWSTLPSTNKIQGAATEPELPQVEELRETPGEESILFDQGRESQDVSRPKASAVAFSSPLTTVPDEVLFQRVRHGDQVRVMSAAEQSPIKQSRVAGALARSRDRAKRHLSIVKQRYTDRPVSRIDENEDDDDRNNNILVSEASPAAASVALATPQQLRQMDGNRLSVAPKSTGRHSSVAFHQSLHLDPLSEFTIHQADESLNLDVNYVRQHHNLVSDAEVDSQFSLAVRELVARVTDIEPFEPYWEYISRLELRGRKLVTLHLLEEFCPRIEELDVDDNELGQVNGGPETLRLLSIQNNCLTSVTSWGHLRNLHYLNASGNQIKDLKGFGCLPHLRELVLNGNEIGCLDGLGDLRGLIKLQMRDNKVRDVSLDGLELPQLVELDLSSNDISSFGDGGSFPALKSLHLSGNQLVAFEPTEICPALDYLDLSKNRLRSVSVAAMHSLAYLNVDCNELSSIQGLSQATRLISLSWRAQTIQNSKEVEWTDAAEVQELALAGNKIRASRLGSTLFLNLRSLDLSCCGLESLSSRFGHMMPNLRRLNLSYNALRDLKPLSGIKKLGELHMVGNRVNRLRSTAAVLGNMGKELEIFDLRMNALTSGFYVSGGGFPSASLRQQQTSLLMEARKGADKARGHNLIESGGKPHDEHDWTGNGNFSDPALDKAHRERMDESTSLRRRVYELLVTNNCPKLRSFDGIEMAQDGSYKEKDDTWDRLVELQVVQMKLPAPPSAA